MDIYTKITMKILSCCVIGGTVICVLCDIFSLKGVLLAMETVKTFMEAM